MKLTALLVVALLSIEVGDRVFWALDKDGKEHCNGIVLEVKNNKLLHVKGVCNTVWDIDDYIRVKDITRVEK